MKNLILVIVFLVSTQASAFVCRDLTNAEGGASCHQLEGFASEQVMVVTGKTAKFIYNSALDSGLTPELESYADDDQYKLTYKGWSCTKSKMNHPISFVLYWSVNLLHDEFDGNIACTKPIFEE